MTKSNLKKISGNIVDVLNSTIYPGTLEISGSKIVNIVKDNKKYNEFILPGFIDAHVHIESSMVGVRGYARVVLPHGVTTAVTDFHEIANVMGTKGIRLMRDEIESIPFNL